MTAVEPEFDPFGTPEYGPEIDKLPSADWGDVVGAGRFAYNAVQHLPEIVSSKIPEIYEGIRSTVGGLSSWFNHARPAPTLAGTFAGLDPGLINRIFGITYDKIHTLMTAAALAAKAGSDANAYTDRRIASIAGAPGAAVADAHGYTDWIALGINNHLTAVENESHDLFNRSVWAGQGEARAVEQRAAAREAQLQHYGEDLYNRSVWHADGLAAQTTHYSEDLYNRAVWHANDLATAARTDLTGAVAKVEADISTAAHAAVDEATRVARATITDVVGPVARSVTDFLSGPWRWAIGILKVLEGMLWWLVWVATHVVPEVVKTVDALRGLVTGDYHSTIQRGASYGAHFRP